MYQTWKSYVEKTELKMSATEGGFVLRAWYQVELQYWYVFNVNDLCKIGICVFASAIMTLTSGTD